MREDEDGSVYGWRRAVGTRAGRVRALGVAFTLMCAILGMLAVITPGDGPGVGGVAAAGAGVIVRGAALEGQPLIRRRARWPLLPSGFGRRFPVGALRPSAVR